MGKIIKEKRKLTINDLTKEELVKLIPAIAIVMPDETFIARVIYLRWLQRAKELFDKDKEGNDLKCRKVLQKALNFREKYLLEDKDCDDISANEGGSEGSLDQGSKA